MIVGLSMFYMGLFVHRFVLALLEIFIMRFKFAFLKKYDVYRPQR